MRKAMFAIVLLGCACTVATPKSRKEPPQEPAACIVRDSSPEHAIAMLAEVNRARQSPREYADTLKRVFATMDASGVYLRGTRGIATVEGRAAVDEAVRFLAASDPVPALRMAGCLNTAAARHAKAKGSTGNYGHFGATGRDPSERASRLTSKPVGCSENIAYGSGDITETVAALIVDDAVPSRGHRQNLFDPRMRSFGSGRAAHLLRNTIDVQLFCLDEIRD